MGARVGAWLIDTLILGGLQLGFWMLAVAVGALSINPEAERQLEASPLTMPTVAPYEANLPLLAGMLAVLVGLSIAYATISWWRFRGLPGQRLLSLQVGSADTGRNLGLGRALVRAIAALGIPLAAGAALLYAIFAYETSVPWSDVLDPRAGGPTEVWLSTWSTILFVIVLVVVAWPVILLTSTAASATHQGLHDRLAKSLVVGKGTPAWVGSAYPPGYVPAVGPQADYLMPGFLAPPGAGSGAGPEPLPGALPPSQSPPGELTPEAWPSGAPGAPGAPDSGMGFGETGPTAAGPAWAMPKDGAAPKPFIATVGRRMSAYLIDCIVVYTVYELIASIIAAAMLPAGTTTFDERTYILIGLAGGLLQLAYFSAGWALVRGTLAQRLMHLRVADVTTGKPLSWLDAVVRWAILQGPFALVTIVPEGVRAPMLFVAAGWSAYLLYTTSADPSLRGLHDRFLNSRVISEP